MAEPTELVRTTVNELVFAYLGPVGPPPPAERVMFDAHRHQLAGLGLGKGCIRYVRPDQIDWAVVAQLLADTRTSTAPIC